MAKNQNDYEIQGKELFLSGQACPNGSSWQQAAMRRGWEAIEAAKSLGWLNEPKARQAVSTKYAVQAHIASLKAQALAEPISSIRYYRLADKVSKMKEKHRMLFSSN